ncbi:hypothetical protein SCHPADRAFT_906223 [Schizopora paradoxa]|uniref:Uncharacterized protein n=1 Tax=Schizopora paradoxa TaxID=27342 RepID=A0A0H2RH43_9AGAM|nr:hypothetical protein SCHPADRAFT_906223 [Schizopora paradoxa]
MSSLLVDGESGSTTLSTSPEPHAEIGRCQRKLFSSLPDDVLAIIFDFVFSASCAEHDDEKSTSSILPMFTILNLSHVNRQFRLISASNPKIWTHIAGSARHSEMGLINACLERSRGLPLTVHLTVYLDSTYGQLCDKVAIATKPHAHRWRTVYVHFNFIQDYSTGFIGTLERLDTLEDVEALLLERIVLDNDTGNFERVPSFVDTWTTPKLRTLVAVRNFPLSLPSIQVLTALDISCSFRNTHFPTLLAVLSKMHSLIDLSIFFDNSQRLFNPHAQIALIRRSVIHSVQRLRLTTATRPVRDRNNEQLEKAMFHALRFPNVEDLTINFIGEPTRYGYPSPQFYLSGAADRILETVTDDDISDLNSKQFPRVSRLRINVSASDPEHENRIGETYLPCGVATLFLPLHIFPWLKELRVRSNMPLDLDSYNFGDHGEQPALHRIEFDISRLASPSNTSNFTDPPSPPLYSKWIRSLANALIDQGVWHEFESFTLVERIFGSIPDSKGFTKWDVKTVLSREMIFTDGN